MKIIWTKHAEQRLEEWGKKRQITRAEVEQIVLHPDQLVCGDLNMLIAQSRRGGGLLRVALTETHLGRKVLTLYWTSKVSKYWREDK